MTLGPDIANVRRVRYVPEDGDEMAAAWGLNKNPADILDPTRESDVAHVEVHSSYTKVWLVDGGGPFNSVHFAEVVSDAR